MDTEIEFDPALWHDNGKPCVVNIGNLADGFRLYGPFANAEEAMKWAKEQAPARSDDQDTVDVIELLSTDN